MPSKQSLVAVHVAEWYASQLKDVWDRFRGTADELGRENRPKERHDEYLQAMGSLISDFDRWFPAEVFKPRKLSPEWRKLGTVAKDCQRHLSEQLGHLCGLTSKDSLAEFDSRYKAASAVLVPLAKKLTAAFKAF